LSARKLVNVIVSAKTSSPLDINLIASTLNQIFYEPEIFSGLVYRRTRPRATIIMFSTGKISSVGTDSMEIAVETLEATVKEISNLQKQSIFLKDPKVENLAMVCDLGSKIDLKRALKVVRGLSYNPERFSAAIYKLKMGDRNISLLLFSSGKIVLTGAKSEDEANDILNSFESMLVNSL
jgi:transcription initiation factor TFIID TATA-box-binding protein